MTAKMTNGHTTAYAIAGFEATNVTSRMVQAQLDRQSRNTEEISKNEKRDRLFRAIAYMKA